MSAPQRAAVLISGRGSNMVAIARRARDEGWLDALAVVVSNRPSAPGLELARELGLATAALDHKPYGKAQRDRFDADLAALLLAHGVRWVVLAGFMRILGPGFLRHFPGRVLNIHPSLLPRFPGLHTHARALDAGVSEHGCSVHLVDESLDGGPLLAQRSVPVLAGDDPVSLAARVLEQEHALYPDVVHAALHGSLHERFPPHHAPREEPSR